MAAVPFACSIAAWLGFHYLIWGSPWPSAPYGGAAGTQMSLRSLVRGVPGLLIDQEYGIFSYAPALAIGVVGLWSMWRAGGRARGLAIEIGAVLAALVGTVGAFQMWWGGTALPGRMLISGLLLLTLPVAWEFSEAADRPERRAAYRLLLLIGLAMSLATVIVRNGATLALGRNGISRFLEWLSPDWHLWAFAPDFIMQPTWLALVQSGIWLLAIALSAWAVGLLAARGTAARGSSRTGRGLAFLRADAGALLAALLVTIVMPPVLRGSLKPSPSPEDRSRIEMLESFDPHARPIGIRYDPFTLVDAASMPQAFAVSARPGSRTARQPTPVLLNARFALPSGRYALELAPRAGVGPAGGPLGQPRPAGRTVGGCAGRVERGGPGRRPLARHVRPARRRELRRIPGLAGTGGRDRRTAGSTGACRPESRSRRGVRSAGVADAGPFRLPVPRRRLVPGGRRVLGPRFQPRHRLGGVADRTPDNEGAPAAAQPGGEHRPLRNARSHVDDRPRRPASRPNSTWTRRRSTVRCG